MRGGSYLEFKKAIYKVVAKAAVLAEGLCPVVTELGACPGAETERRKRDRRTLSKEYSTEGDKSISSV